MNFLDRGNPADHLLGSQRHQIHVVAQAHSLIGVLDQGMQPTGNGGAGGVVAGGGDDQVVRDNVDVGQALTIDDGIGDGRGQVLRRVFAARRRQRVEVFEHVQQCGPMLLWRGAPLEFVARLSKCARRPAPVARMGHG
jgi:hypothetical protein